MVNQKINSGDSLVTISEFGFKYVYMWLFSCLDVDSPVSITATSAEMLSFCFCVEFYVSKFLAWHMCRIATKYIGFVDD